MGIIVGNVTPAGLTMNMNKAVVDACAEDLHTHHFDLVELHSLFAEV